MSVMLLTLLAFVAVVPILVAVIYGLRHYGLLKLFGAPNPIAVAAAIGLFFLGSGSIWNRISEFWWMSLLIIGLSSLVHRSYQGMARELSARLQGSSVGHTSSPAAARLWLGIVLPAIFAAVAVFPLVTGYPRAQSSREILEVFGTTVSLGVLAIVFSKK